MYDVDGNGVIDQDEMTKIIQVSSTNGQIFEENQTLKNC